MTRSTVNEVVYQGEELVVPFVITDADGDTIDIRTATFEWVLYDIREGVVARKALADGIAFGVAKEGQVAATLPITDTESLLTVPYQHELAMTLDGNYSIEATGTITILKNIALL